MLININDLLEGLAGRLSPVLKVPLHCTFGKGKCFSYSADFQWQVLRTQSQGVQRAQQL